MFIIFKLFVEKKTEFQIESKQMLSEIKNYLGIGGILELRIFNGYTISGISEEAFEKSKYTVFAEPGLDNVFEDIAGEEAGGICFTTEYLPGQYDQRADFAAQLLQIQFLEPSPVVRTFRHFIIYGQISPENLQTIKSYYINPVEMRELSLDKLKACTSAYSEPGPVERLELFNSLSGEQLEQYGKQYGIAMSLENLELCQDYFKKENKMPSLAELKILDTYWSDHCRHSTFLAIIENVEIEKNLYTKGLEQALQLFEQAREYVYGEEKRPLCLMDIATMEMKKMRKAGLLEDMEDSEEVNACSIEVTAEINGKPEDYIIMFKNETHNHPTEMEPFGGASTCLGGGIRDPLSGRAYVYGAIRLTGSADPREAFCDTLPGKLPQRKITKTAADGYSSYGNQIGLASGHLIEVYDPGFKAKRMECGALVAAVPKAHVTRGTAETGDVICLLGGNTGRDGLGGATGSSKEQDEGALEKGGAEVQKGNPVIERNIVRLFRNPKASKLIKKCNDFGAGGVSVAVSELAESLLIDLDKVPVKYPGLDGTELAISESQERMAVLLSASDLDTFCKYAAEENLNAVKIAVVTDTNRVVMMWRGQEIANISSKFLNSGGVRRHTSVKVTAPLFKNVSEDGELKKKWLQNLSGLNVCSKKGIAKQFDQVAGNVSVFMPFGGLHQRTPEQGLAMRLPLLSGTTDLGTLMTVGYNPALAYESPFHAALYAVIESVMKIAAMGGDYKKVRLSFQEYFESPGNKPESWGKPFAALLGAFLAQEALQIPSIGGKDSMSGTFKDINVPPSLISFALVTADTTKLVSRAFKKSGHPVILADTPVDESGLLNFDILKNNMEAVHKLAQQGIIKAASVVGFGGIAAAVSEMVFGNEIGFSFAKDFKDELFSPRYGSMILEVESLDLPENLSYKILGHTTEEKSILSGDCIIALDEALKAFECTLEKVFPTQPQNPAVSNGTYEINPIKAQYGSIKNKPKVIIPIFPGTTGEYELEKQFAKAGAEVITVLFRNRSPKEIEDSYKRLSSAIHESDMLAIASGYTAGAEPEGSAKLISIVLTEPSVRTAVNELLNRKGLVLGLGEGFKALLKTGLIQTGAICENYNSHVFITKSPLNQFHCQLAYSKIINEIEPWFKGKKNHSLIVPISILEGSIRMSHEDYKTFFEKGQIAAQYTDSNGHVAKTPEHNPLCSDYAIEAMVSENGQILGRIASVDRLEKGLYVNVFGARDCEMFKNAVEYFTATINTNSV